MSLPRVIFRWLTAVAMGFLYFLVVTPIAIVVRTVSHNPIRHLETHGGFWQPPTGSKNMERQS